MSLDVSEQYDKIYRYCYMRVSNRDVAEDITQETFLKYLEHPQYHGIDKTLHLLYTIAGNLCIDYFRSKKTAELPEDAVSPQNVEEDVLNNFALSEALKKLPEEDREIILLRYVNDVPVGVIAELHKISRFALNRRIKNILAALRKDLGKEELE